MCEYVFDVMNIWHDFLKKLIFVHKVLMLFKIIFSIQIVFRVPEKNYIIIIYNMKSNFHINDS
jgi:hypothetical protein